MRFGYSKIAKWRSPVFQFMVIFWELTKCSLLYIWMGKLRFQIFWYVVCCWFLEVSISLTSSSFDQLCGIVLDQLYNCKCAGVVKKPVVIEGDMSAILWILKGYVEGSFIYGVFVCFAGSCFLLVSCKSAKI